MDPSQYAFIYTISVAVLGLLMATGLLLNTGDTLLYGNNGRRDYGVMLAIGAALALWLGFRPVDSAFGDTVNYALSYNLMQDSSLTTLTLHGEWAWSLYTRLCRWLDLDVHTFLFFPTLAYIFTGLWAVKRFMPTRPYLGMLFMLCSAFFFSYAVNGVRNGLGLSIALLGMAYLLDERYLAAGICGILGLGFHSSVLLPIAAFLAAVYVIKSPRVALWIWAGCILVSFFAGSAFHSIFSSIGLDDRMAQYAQLEGGGAFGRVGEFRWDFLALSTIPVIYYLIVNSHEAKDGWFNTLMSTYLLANAFWVLVIRIAFSNRFAYLSWFLMPVILAYPLSNMRVWKWQNQAGGIILILYILMSLALSLVIFKV